MLVGTPQAKRAKLCGVHRTGGGVQISLREGGYAVTTGLVSCGSVHACPVCAASIAKERADELVSVVEAYRKQGCVPYLVGLTIPHERHDELAPLLSALTRAWRSVWAGRLARRAIRSLGREGYVRAREVTHGQRSSWHPHLHALFVGRYHLEQRLTDDELEQLRGCELEAVTLLRELRALYAAKPRGERLGGHGRKRAAEIRAALVELEPAILRRPSKHDGKAMRRPQSIEGFHLWLWRRWARAAKRFGVKRPSIDAGVHITRADNAAAYLAKMGLALEVTHGNAKTGRGAHRSPFQVLAAAAYDRRYRGLWQEYVEATWRTRQIVWSRGLTRKLHRRMRDDEEIAADAGRAIGWTLVLDPKLWDDWLRWRPAVERQLRAAVAANDKDTICDLLADAKGSWYIDEAALEPPPPRDRPSDPTGDASAFRESLRFADNLREIRKQLQPTRA